MSDLAVNDKELAMNGQATAKYDWDASDYAEQSSAQLIWAEELLAKINLSGSEQVLDLGCGDGKITAAIAAGLSNGKVTGIDSSQQMVSLTQKRFAVYENLIFENDDATTFSYKDKYDVVFSNAVLHWVQDHEAVLKNCQQSLLVGGKVLLQMGGKGNATEFIDVVSKVINKSNWKHYFNQFSFPFYFYAVEDYEVWLRESGFRQVELN